MRFAIIIVVAMNLAALRSYADRDAKTAQQKSASAPGQKVPAYNPYRAVHDVEVGKFYLKRGDLAGAIARFKEAMLYKDNYAEPRMLLGEAYEKNNDPATAIHYFEEYLKILPESPDSKKVREQIAELQEKLKKGTAARR